MNRRGEQVAALPVQPAGVDGLRVLMVTSRGTGRWVIPKGWEEPKMPPWAAAAVEALEEAGAMGTVAPETIGSYSYGKILGNGIVLPCRVRVYPLLVETLLDDWKERAERTREWFPPDAAAELVHEPELAALLRKIGKTGGLGAVFPAK